MPFSTAEEADAASPAAVAHLRGDGIIAYPTETVYGLGCLLRTEPLRRLARLKQRTPDKPFLLLVDTPDRLPGLGWSVAARRLAAAFWPGPLTLALPVGAEALPAEVVAPDGTTALRATSHPQVRSLLRALAEPLTSTSANAPGEPPASTGQETAAALERLDARDALLLDAGALPASAPSTLVSCALDRPRLLRAGAVPLEALRNAVPEIDD